eukprot:jgi/Mesen1/4919/ME000246S04138
MEAILLNRSIALGLGTPTAVFPDGILGKSKQHPAQTISFRIGPNIPAHAAHSNWKVSRSRPFINASLPVQKGGKRRSSSLENGEGERLGCRDDERRQHIGLAAATLAASTALSPSEAAEAATLYTPNVVYGEVASVLEASVQLLYLGSLLVLLGAGSFLVVRQVLIRRELENAAKELQDRVRSGQASSEEYFELGAVMLRKKFYYMADKYLEQAIKKWEGDEQDLAQVYNALGFSYYSENKVDKAIKQYEKAVQLQPGYVTAWNNLGDAYEKDAKLPQALRSYEEALIYDPSNRVAQARRDDLKPRVETFQSVQSAQANKSE